MGMRNGIGNTHINKGDKTSAPPKPLNRLIQPPKRAAKIIKETEAMFSIIRLPRSRHARLQLNPEFGDAQQDTLANPQPFGEVLERE